jgi:hypothetical protein
MAPASCTVPFNCVSWVSCELTLMESPIQITGSQVLGCTTAIVVSVLFGHSSGAFWGTFLPLNRKAVVERSAGFQVGRRDQTE